MLPTVGADAAIAVVVTMVVTAGCMPVLIRVLERSGVLDLPNQRSSHASVVPRGAGLIVVPASLVGLVVATSFHGTAFAIAAGTLLFAGIGLTDDLRALSAHVRLVAQVVLAVAVIVVIASSLGPLVGLLAVVCLIGYVNAFNFMDGVNGLAAVQAAVAGVTWWVVADRESVALLGDIGVVVAAGALAFLPFNFPRARIFLGDVGSYGLGALLACAAIFGVREDVSPEAMVAPLAIFGLDTLVTLVRRARAHRPLLEAHREHTYQQLLDLGWSHARVTMVVGGFIVACAGAGLVSLSSDLRVRLVGDAVVLAVAAVYLLLPAISSRSASHADR